LTLTVEIDKETRANKTVMNLIKNKIISNKYTLNDLFDEFDKMCINIIPNYNVLYKLYRIQKTN